jgi:hypothetical protein
VQRIDEGRGVEVKDVFEGDTFFVNDIDTSGSASRWDCLIGRIHQLEGQWLFASDRFRVPRPMLPAVRECVEAGRRKARVPAAEFFRSHSHEWRRFVLDEHAGRLKGLRLETTDGDPIEFSTAEYDAPDPDAVASALAGFAEIAQAGEPPGTRVFHWRQTDGEPADRMLFGRIEIAAGKLAIASNSRRRLEIGRKLVEERCGNLVRHLGDAFESVDELKRRVGEPQAAAESAEVDPEIAREVVLQYKTKHYATWPDERLATLDGKTPREAMRSKAGREAVERLLRDFENAEERERRAGRPAFDFSDLRATLGL